MKNLLSILLVSSFIFFASCDSGTKSTKEEDPEATKKTGFGGQGADPSSGTVVSEDTAAAPIDQGTDVDSEGDSAESPAEQ